MKTVYFTFSLYKSGFLFLLCYIISLTPSNSQSQEWNMMKYWKHRGRLNGDGTPENPGFIWRNNNGLQDSGSYLPAEHVIPFAKPRGHWYYSSVNNCFDEFDFTDCGGMNFGDAPTYLGQYIGVLATEFRLLKDHGLISQANETGEELLNAILAFERLDLAAEPHYGLGASLNGCFLRSDMMANFPDDGTIVRFPGITAAGTSLYSDVCEIRIPDTFATRTSADHMLGMLMGFALVKRCLSPSELIINGTDVRLRAQENTHRMLIRLRNDRWQMKDPLGNSNGNLGAVWMQTSFPFAKAGNWITENRFVNTYHDTYPVILPSSSYTVAALLPTLVSLQTGQGPNQFSGCLVPVLVHPLLLNAPIPWIGYSTTYGQFFWILNKKLVKESFSLSTCGTICVGQMLGGTFANFLHSQFNLPLGCVTISDFGGFAFDNDVPLWQTFAAASISDSWDLNEFQSIASDHGLEFFDLLRSFLYGTPVDSDNKAASKFDIEFAPCDKFCGNNDAIRPVLGDWPDPRFPNNEECNRPWTCNNIPGWRATNRWMHVNKANITDIGTPSSDHNGLDFLLLYNLYALLFPGEVENYYGNNFSGIRNININFPLQMLNFGNGANPALWISSDQISSTSVISAYPSNSPIVNQSGNVTFRAGNSIILEPGFMAEPGVVFEAIIAPPLCEEATGEFHKKALAKPSEIIITTPEVQIIENPDLKITAFPNPFSGELKIKVEGNYSGPLKVKVFDMLGNQIEHREQTPIQGIITINTESLANGIYFVQIQCAEMVFNFKANKI